VDQSDHQWQIINNLLIAQSPQTLVDKVDAVSVEYGPLEIDTKKTKVTAITQ